MVGKLRVAPCGAGDRYEFTAGISNFIDAGCVTESEVRRFLGEFVNGREKRDRARMDSFSLKTSVEVGEEDGAKGLRVRIGMFLRLDGP